MPNRNLTRRIDAIRNGFDDRLLTLVEYDPNTAASLEAIGDRIRTWRHRFDDELEVFAFMRIGPTAMNTNNDALDIETQCKASRYLSSQGLPVAVAVAAATSAARHIDEPPVDRTLSSNIEYWSPCNDDLRYLLKAARLPADLLLCAHDTPRPGCTQIERFIGAKPPTSHAAQTTFVAAFAQHIAMRENTALGIVLTPFGTAADPIPADGQALLASLADAVYHRRIRCAA